MAQQQGPEDGTDGLGRAGPVRSMLRQLPVAVTGLLIGGVVFGVLGGVAGLVIGLRVYPPTAWFAVFELGVPAGLVGAVLGLLGGSLIQLIATYRARADHQQTG